MIVRTEILELGNLHVGKNTNDEEHLYIPYECNAQSTQGEMDGPRICCKVGNLQLELGQRS